MERAKRQMKVKLFQTRDKVWTVKPEAAAARVENNLFIRPTKRKNPAGYVTVEEHRQLRLKITSELLDRDTPLRSYDDLEPNECRAIVAFINEVPLDIVDEVRQEYDKQAKELIAEKIKAYAA